MVANILGIVTYLQELLIVLNPIGSLQTSCGDFVPAPESVEGLLQSVHERPRPLELGLVLIIVKIQKCFL